MSKGKYYEHDIVIIIMIEMERQKPPGETDKTLIIVEISTLTRIFEIYRLTWHSLCSIYAQMKTMAERRA